MRTGFALPQFGPSAAASPDGVARFAREAEALGAASLWAADRLLVPTRPTVGYGGTTAIPERFRSALDPFLVLTTAAAVTTRPLLGFSVLNAPFYSPVLLARQLTTLDVLSNGRVIPGFGVGWSPEEYGALNVPMSERGARLEETLDILDALWTAGPVSHQGAFWEIPEIHADLRPVQRPAPPVYLGGTSPAALSRVARRAAGWLPATVADGHFDAAGIAGSLEHIRAQAATLGRPAPGAILLVSTLPTTTVTDIRAVLTAAEEVIGINHAIVGLMTAAADVDEALSLAARLLA